MINPDSKEIFRKKMANEGTRDLIRILWINNPREWSDEQIKIIADIVRSRVKRVLVPPPQLPHQPGVERKPPSRIVPQPPRAARPLSTLSFGEAVFYILLLLAGLLIPVLAFLFGQIQLDSCLRLKSEGLSAFATVIKVERTSEDAYVHYTFSPTHIDRRVTAVINLLPSNGIPGIGIPEVGQTIEVIYEASNPDHSAVKGLESCLSPAVPILLFIALLLPCFLPVFYFARFIYLAQEWSR